jgi:ssDNA-binding Zn-finger/Zn-ribbon topoisomerase 1
LRLEDLTPEVRAYVLAHKSYEVCPKCGRLDRPRRERVKRKDGSIVEQTEWGHYLPDDPTEKWDLTTSMVYGKPETSMSSYSKGIHKSEYRTCVITDLRVIREPRKPCPKCHRIGRECTDKRGYRYVSHGRARRCYIGKP